MHQRSFYPGTAAICVSLLVLGLVAPAVGYGEDFDERSLEELTRSGLSTLSRNVESSTASKYRQRGGDTPGVTRIVTAEDIRTYGYRTVAEILRSLPGIYVTHDRNYTYVGVRGFGRPNDFNSRVLLLIDGERINDNIYDGGLVGNEFPVDVDLIDRVEYAPGPGSAVYGNNAFFGVINVLTKRGQDLSGASLSAEYGSFDTYKARGSFGKRFDNGAEILLSATGFDREGPDRLYETAFDTPGRNRGRAEGLDYDRFHSAFAKLIYGDLQIQGGYVDRTKGIPTGSYGQVFNDPRSKTRDAQTFLSLAYDRALSAEWQFFGRLGYHRYEFAGDYPLEPDGIVNRDVGFGEWWDGELRLLNTSFEGHRLLAGAEIQDNLQQNLKNFDRNGVYLDQPYSSLRWGVYLQDEMSLLDSLTLTLGARYDYNPLGGPSANPRIALVWRPLETTTLKLRYGTAFRAPNVYERDYQGMGYLRNARLRPETIETLELAVDHYFTPSSRLSASLYHSTIDRLIEQSAAADGSTAFVNLKGVESFGAELEAEQRFRNGLSAQLSYSIQRTREDGGNILTNSPAHMAKLHLSAPLWSEHWRAGLETLYTSARRTRSGRVDDYVLANLTVNADLLKYLRLSFGVYNLLNQRYADPVTEDFRQDRIFQDGLGFRLKLSVDY